MCNERVRGFRDEIVEAVLCQMARDVLREAASSSGDPVLPLDLELRTDNRINI